MSSFCKCKSYSHFFSKNITIFVIFNDESFNDTLTNDIVSFEQLGPALHIWHSAGFLVGGIKVESENTVLTLYIWTSPYHTDPKIWPGPFNYLFFCLNHCWMSGKQSRPRSDNTLCSTWSGYTLVCSCLFLRLKHCWMSGKQCRPRSDATQWHLIWVYTVCSCLSVQKLRVNTVTLERHKLI